VTSTGARQAHLDSFDLHATVPVAANNREGLEQLARYGPGHRSRRKLWYNFPWEPILREPICPRTADPGGGRR
jgi:hypothetical protein